MEDQGDRLEGKMEDQGAKLSGMGVFGLMKEAVKLMYHNFALFLTFVTSFTIPSSLFTIFVFSAVDLHHHYVLSDFIGKGELVIFKWKFETLISPLALNFGFILINLAPAAWLNTAVCTRGVISIYQRESLTTSIKNTYINVHKPVFRLVATQSILYLLFLAILCLSLSQPKTNPLIYIPITLLIVLYHLPSPQVAIVERRYCAVFRAMEVACSKLWTSLGLAVFSVLWFGVLKLSVEFLLKEEYPLWRKALAYPPLVVAVVFMSIFWQVVYTLLYLSSVKVDLENLDVESGGVVGDVNQPLLVDGNEESDAISTSHHGIA